MACPLSRLVFTTFPLLLTLILSVPFGQDTNSAFLGGSTPTSRDDLHGVPVFQLQTPFTKGRPQNHFEASQVSTTPSRDGF